MQKELLECKILIKKYEKSLKLFSNIYNKAKPTQKHKYINPLRSAGISYHRALMFQSGCGKNA